jgi:hypothetical protein
MPSRGGGFNGAACSPGDAAVMSGGAVLNVAMVSVGRFSVSGCIFDKLASI